MGRSSSDFEFWEETLPVDPRSCGDSFEGQTLIAEDQEGAYSPPLWTRAQVDCKHETSRLLPRRHGYSCLSPASRLRAIMDGRQELMEMIQDLPESSYELTLKDIVDDQQNMEEVQEKKVIVEEKKVKHQTESRPQNSRKTKNRQICRTESMESEVFLLKMFLPASLSSKKKPETRKHPKPCPRKSLEGSEKRAAKDWWKMIFVAVKDKRNTTSISRSTSDISSNRTSLAENALMSSQWSFSKENCKSRGQRGCLF